MTESVSRYQMLKDITPRLYQETILSTCVEKNTLVVIPTGMGKTVIALLLSEFRLRSFPKSKILFLAPTRPLVEQHLQTFKRHFSIPEEKLAIFTGNVKPEKRQAMWADAQIVFSTPQGLENDLIANRIKLDDVSLIIFDEAHRATGSYAYTFIAKRYDVQARYPRTLSLTASPGSNLESIMEVCKNLHVEDVELRQDTDPDVRPYIQQVDLQWVKVDLPLDLMKIRDYLKACFKSKLVDIKNNGYIQSSQINTLSKTDILKLQGKLHGDISRGDKSSELFKSISLLAEAMKVQHALELVETQGIAALHSYLEKMNSEAGSTKVKAVQNLVRDLNFKSACIKTRTLYDAGAEHPKLPKLRQIVASELSKHADAKILLFSQFRDTAHMIRDSISDMPGVRPKCFIGQANRKEKGLTQKKQKEMLEEFKRGDCNVLVATSVAEEGLDIPKVDTVVFYEPVPSNIRTIQRRGRTGRQEKGSVIVLMTRGTRDEGYKWSAHHKEKRMQRTLEGLKSKLALTKVKRKQNTLENFMLKDIGVKIAIDHRERGSSVVKTLVGMEANIDLKTLEVGDFVLSSRVAVEYKTVPDFVDSLIDGRLLKQVKALKNNYERPLIIIEGEEDIYSQRKIHPNAIRGMLSTIMVSFGIPIFQTRTSKETAEMLAIIARREQDNSSTQISLHARKPLSLSDQQEYIVSALPGVGPTLCKPLLDKFGSIKNISNASIDALQEIDKIGEKKAKEIQIVLTEEYKLL